MPDTKLGGIGVPSRRGAGGRDVRQGEGIRARPGARGGRQRRHARRGGLLPGASPRAARVVDRLSRDYATLVVLERRLQRHGVEVVSVAEENGDGPVAEFMRGQLALVAQLERAMIVDRVRKGKAERKRQGRHVHGRIPYGYRSAGDGRLELVDEEAQVVRCIFELAKKGKSLGVITDRLNDGGTSSPQDKAWRRFGVSRILANPVYVGERYGVKKAQPAIVSRQLWNAVQAGLERRGRRAG
jgi:Recombinase/Resolvase, N terminal domain